MKSTATLRKTVLLVEDDLDVRMTVTRVLGSKYNVSMADNGETALWRFEHGQRFDVILCDLKMPKMDGVVFLERLRQLDPVQASRVIVLSANAETPLAAQLGGKYFVVEKPFTVAKLRELVDRVTDAAHDGYFPSSSS